MALIHQHSTKIWIVYFLLILHCRSSADRSEMIRIRADLIRADLDQGKKVLLICGFRSGSSADRSVLGLMSDTQQTTPVPPASKPKAIWTDHNVTKLLEIVKKNKAKGEDRLNFLNNA